MFFILIACMHPTTIVTLDPVAGTFLVADDYNRLYACDTSPVGNDFRPTCVRVDYSHEVPWWVRRHYTTIGVHNPAAANGAAEDTEEQRKADEAEHPDE